MSKAKLKCKMYLIQCRLNLKDDPMRVIYARAVTLGYSEKEFKIIAKYFCADQILVYHNNFTAAQQEISAYIESKKAERHVNLCWHNPNQVT